MADPEPYDVTRYERPSVTVDTVLLSLRDGRLEVLLVQRKHPPFQGVWALPGGFVDIDEPLEAAARRELAEETGIDDPDMRLEQLRAYGQPDRDPRTRVISVAYLAIICAARLPVRAGSDAADAAWHSADAPPALAFDHGRILSDALRRLRHAVQYSGAMSGLMPEAFTLSELQAAFECVLGERVDKRNFRRKTLATGALEATPEVRGGGHRPARLYRFRREATRALRARRLFP